MVKGYKKFDRYGVDFGRVDFAAVAEVLGVWSRRVETMQELDEAVAEGLTKQGPVVLDVSIDPSEYRAHAAR